MTAADEPLKRGSRRLINFLLELWDVLRWPSSVIVLDTLVLGGFFAGVIFIQHSSSRIPKNFAFPAMKCVTMYMPS